MKKSAPHAKNLVIVESPAKAKTIKKYLGEQFDVVASYGHVRDLLAKKGAVEPQNHFAMHYVPIEKNEKHFAAIKTGIKQASALYLATDPDREGEAISWHILCLLEAQGLLKNKPVHRIAFHEITQSAIRQALEHPRDISMDLVNAQQARRALDYLVGFNLSPLLWQKVRRGLSAGRVQSPALRMIVEREEEIERFTKQEYWDITARCTTQHQPFKAKLTHYQHTKLEQFSITTAEQADTIQQALMHAADGSLTVTKVDKKQRKRNPAPPFITSTLQQEAARKLGFAAQRTMRIAQQLYEGIDLDHETVGLITYMRTDSLNLAQDAISEIRDFIRNRYGKDQIPTEPKRYRTSSKNAQEAHEAIRPTSIFHVPENIKSHLSTDQYKLYDLIWKRTLASQMIHATFNTVAADLEDRNHNLYRANGSTLIDPGFIRIYQEGVDDQEASGEENSTLPPLEKNQVVELLALEPNQHFTEPPPRYSEASLIKALEEHGIGRPSTYATILQTLQQREYAILDQKRFKPSDIGRIVNKFLTAHFTSYVDYDFTARLEDDLDAIANGERAWIPLLENFWELFKEAIDHTAENVQRSDFTQERLDENCPTCGKPLSLRLGKFNRFIGCTGYPECKYTRNADNDTSQETTPVILEAYKCPKCAHPLQERMGRYGKFIGCTQYPTCKYIESLNKPENTNVQCPDCHRGHLLKRKSRRGKFFYSCEHYPTCQYAVWNPPVAKPCSRCGWPIVTLKITKRRGAEHVCPIKTCGCTEPAPFPDEMAHPL